MLWDMRCPGYEDWGIAVRNKDLRWLTRSKNTLSATWSRVIISKIVLFALLDCFSAHCVSITQSQGPGTLTCAWMRYSILSKGSPASRLA